MDGAHLLDLAARSRPAPLGPPLIVDSFAGGGGASTRSHLSILTPRELLTAQGFPTDEVIEGFWHERDGAWSWTGFTKGTQVGCVGNSVCPPVAAAVVGANCGQLVVKEEVA